MANDDRFATKEEYLAWAQARIKEMREEAEADCEELGLPKEMAYIVMGLNYGRPRRDEHQQISEEE